MDAGKDLARNLEESRSAEGEEENIQCRNHCLDSLVVRQFDISTEKTEYKNQCNSHLEEKIQRKPGRYYMNKRVQQDLQTMVIEVAGR